jgi:hypothetical protein
MADTNREVKWQVKKQNSRHQHGSGKSTGRTEEMVSQIAGVATWHKQEQNTSRKALRMAKQASRSRNNMLLFTLRRK